MSALSVERTISGQDNFRLEKWAATYFTISGFNMMNGSE